MGFGKIYGNRDKIEYLLKLNKNKNFPNSMLFYGPESIGKKMIAFGLLKTINCLKEENDYCDECRNCNRINNNEFPDIYYIDTDDKQIKIQEIEKIRKMFSYKNFESTYRTIIINDAHLCNDTASNALLKSLEEPPDNSFFILISSKPHSILPTILSRSIKIKFSLLKNDEFYNYINSNYDIKEDEKKYYSCLSQNTPGIIKKYRDIKIIEIQELIFKLLTFILKKNLSSFIIEYNKIKFSNKNSNYTVANFNLILNSFLQDISHILSDNRDTLTNFKFDSIINDYAKLLSFDKIRKLQDLLYSVISMDVFNITPKLIYEKVFMTLFKLCYT